MRDPEGRFRVSETGTKKASQGIAPISAFLSVIALLVAVLAALVFLGGRLSALPALQFGRNGELPELWEQGRYDMLIESANQRLDERPLDYEALLLSGFSFFYLGVDQIDDEIRVEYMNEATVRLRKALLHERVEMRGELRYILGKAYFHKGSYYYDLAVEYIETALEEDAYKAIDTHEYLALSYARLGDLERSAHHLERAVETNPSDLLHYSLGNTRVELGRTEDAMSSFRDVVRTTEDEYLQQQARIRLGELLHSSGNYEEAEEQLRLVLMDNPRSADAHYVLGELYNSRGDRERARFEWREAVRIEPRHVDALRSLQNN